jgi:hypothetical protein
MATKLPAALADERLLIEERRLRRAFLPLLLLTVGAPAAAVACSTGASDSSLGSAALRDTSDGGADIDLDGGVCGLQDAAEPATSDAGTCADYKLAPCGLPSDYVSVEGFDNCHLDIGRCARICNRPMRGCHAYGDSCVDGGIVTGKPVLIECSICPGDVGRRPEGFDATPAQSNATTPLGAFFAEVARLEAASIDAFERLEDELAQHGAPRHLVEAASLSRADEVEHARVMGDFAQRHGATPAYAPRGSWGPRPLVDVARENMVEGCVRETLGALVAEWQAAHAPDPELAAALGQIARDELRHAALSWAIARWSDSVLTPDERADVAHARAAAVETLAEEAVRPLHPVLVKDAGLPPPAIQAQMLDGLRQSLWG